MSAVRLVNQTRPSIFHMAACPNDRDFLPRHLNGLTKSQSGFGGRVMSLHRTTVMLHRTAEINIRSENVQIIHDGGRLPADFSALRQANPVSRNLHLNLVRAQNEININEVNGGNHKPKLPNVSSHIQKTGIGSQPVSGVSTQLFRPDETTYPNEIFVSYLCRV